jgi:hypothetical protein
LRVARAVFRPVVFVVAIVSSAQHCSRIYFFAHFLRNFARYFSTVRPPRMAVSCSSV